MSIFSSDIGISTRLTVLETMFKQFMAKEDASFVEVKKTLEQIVKHIDDSKITNQRMISESKKEILDTIEAQYCSKVDASKAMTGIRTSLLQDLRHERTSTFKSIWVLCAVFTAAIVLCGWLYINVLPRGDKHAVYKQAENTLYKKHQQIQGYSRS